jgi:transglutaminase-like putative cysteine protease
VELGSSAGALIGRLHTWFVALAEGQQLFDPVVIALLWSLALWGTVVWASWAVGRRAQPVWGAAPAVALLASILSYAGGRALYLLPMLAPTLVLKALTWYDSRRRHWEQDGIEHAPRIRANTGWTAVGLSLALMVVAALTPSVSVYRIVDYVRSVPRQWVQVDEPEAAARSVGLEPRPETEDSNVLVAMASAQRAGGLPASHLIGSGPELSEQLIMIVSDETEFEPNRTSALRPTPRYYWRGTTYDRYTGRGWCTRDVTVVDYAAGELAVPTPWGSRRLLRQEIHAVEDNDGLLYVAGSLVTADQEYQVAWRLRPEAGERGDAFGATTKATRYRTDSLLPVIGEADLRAAGQDYPVSVVDRYLALPDSVPDRVSALARDLTATELTPYDRALAIVGYLRSFPYTLDLPAPPVDRDIADYFLFDLQEGYCDYYATAMVVLARAAGLPARLVTGYASGDYNEAEAQYVVTAEQAHSWAEIYFPGYGWIEFEPTADRPAIERPAGALSETSPRPETPLEPITARRARASRTRYLRIGGGLLVLVVGVVLTWPVVDGWRLGRLSAKARVTCLLRRLYRHGRWLGVLSRRGDTLHEFAAALVMRVKDLAEMRSWGAVLVSVPAEIDWLTDLCVRFLYSSHQPGVGEQAQAVRTWRRLRRRLWLAILFTSIPRSEAVRSHRENAE